jgi:hypothetical protein
METLKKIGVFLLISFLALPTAGIYGAVHDQISYTVSHEYFTKFKFIQFGLVELNASERTKAAVVGFLATWWMGIPIGLLVGGGGFIHKGYKRMLLVSIQALGIVVAVTLMFGIGGLIFGYARTAHFNLGDYQGWFVPEGLTEPRRFLCAGYMHNASYLGGVLAIFAGWSFHLVKRLRQK